MGPQTAQVKLEKWRIRKWVGGIGRERGKAGEPLEWIERNLGGKETEGSTARALQSTLGQGVRHRVGRLQTRESLVRLSYPEGKRRLGPVRLDVVGPGRQWPGETGSGLLGPAREEAQYGLPRFYTTHEKEGRWG